MPTITKLAAIEHIIEVGATWTFITLVKIDPNRIPENECHSIKKSASELVEASSEFVDNIIKTGELFPRYAFDYVKLILTGCSV